MIYVFDNLIEASTGETVRIEIPDDQVNRMQPDPHIKYRTHEEIRARATAFALRCKAKREQRIAEGTWEDHNKLRS